MRTSRRTVLPLVVSALCLAPLLLGCSDDKPAPPPAGDTPPSTAWRSVVGAGGEFAQTFDDVHWQHRNVASFDLLSVACVGNRDGWVAGTKGAVGRTRDGGKTWSFQQSHLTVDLRAIRFGDAAHGVVAGDAGALAVTDDGGENWRVIVSPTGVNLRGTAVAWSRSLYVVVGERGTVLRSLDAGLSWTSVVIEGAADLRGVASDMAGHRLVAVDSIGGIFGSADLGLHFTKEATAPAALDAVAMSDDGMRVLAAGAAGTVMSSEAPRVWRTVDSGTTADLHAALASNGRLYAAGDAGTLVMSSDGTRWSKVPLGTTATLFALEDL